MSRRRTSPRPGRWRCRLCPTHGIDPDPRTAFEAHYAATHSTTPC